MREIVNSKELKSAREGFRSMCLGNFTRTLLAVACCAGLMPLVSSAESLRVGTWNIRLSDMDRWDKLAGAPHWRERMPSVAAALKARNCDLVGLQECSTPQACFKGAHVVVTVPPGGKTFRLAQVDAADEKGIVLNELTCES